MRRLSLACFALVICCHCLPAQAQWGGTFFNNVKRDTSRNNTWPDPFVCRDRDLVTQPVSQTAANGWKRLCVLQAYHFDENSQLTLAGEQKLTWILTQTPPSRRTVWVQRGTSADVTHQRLASVNQMASALSPNTQLPLVMETDRLDEGSPAQEINDVSVKFRESRPEPRVKLSSAGGSGSGGSGGASQ